MLLVYAKTDREKGAHGISAFIVEKDFPGFRVAQKLEKMGYRGSQTGELVFEDCRVPGREPGWRREPRRRDRDERARPRTRDDLADLSRRRRARARAFASTTPRRRQQFGKPIGSFQMVQSMLADMYVLVETMRTFTYRTLAAAAEVEIGEGGRGDIHKLTAASVMYAADAVHKVLDKALQIHGGSGYIWESEINRLYRSTKLLEIGAGTTEVRKMIIAGELLKDMRAVTDSPATFGLDDEALATRRPIFAADAYAGQVALVSGGSGGIGRGDCLAARAPRRACRRRRPQRGETRRARRGDGRARAASLF